MFALGIVKVEYMQKKIKKCGTILYKLEMAHMHGSTLIIFYKLFYTINIFIIKNFNFLQDEYETF